MRCEIYFPNNPSGVFRSGQLLSGLVVLKLVKPMIVRGIYVEIIGRAYCQWVSGAGRESRTNVGEELYLNENTFLVGGVNGEVLLSPSDCNYTFSCMLPVDLPTSVEGKSGCIRYSVTVHINRHTSMSGRKFKEYFTVIKELNLNDEIALRYPLIREERKIYCICCFLSNQTLDISVCVPVGGYVPGQTIALLLEINNLASGKNFPTFVVHIMKHIQYHTHAYSSTKKLETTVVKSATCRGCRRYQSVTHTLSIIVPPLPPTDESTSNIVKVSYQLQILGTVLCSPDDPFPIPIKIGTYPILLNNTSITQQPTVSSRVNFGIQPQQILGKSFHSTPFKHNAPGSSATSVNADWIDAPTYKKETTSCPDNGNRATFRPSYPVFRRTPIYSTKVFNFSLPLLTPVNRARFKDNKRSR